MTDTPAASRRSTSRAPLTEEQISKYAARLTRDHLAILSLYEVRHMTYVAIAQDLGIAEGTVRSRLNRARGVIEALIAADAPKSGETGGRAPDALAGKAA